MLQKSIDKALNTSISHYLLDLIFIPKLVDGMKNTKENKMIEIEHYYKIFEYFEEEKDRISREIFRDKYLASLMAQLKQNPDIHNIVKNSIVIMNVLIDDNKPADIFNKIGLSKEELSEKDAKIIRKKLIKLISTY